MASVTCVCEPFMCAAKLKCTILLLFYNKIYNMCAQSEIRNKGFGWRNKKYKLNICTGSEHSPINIIIFGLFSIHNSNPIHFFIISFWNLYSQLYTHSILFRFVHRNYVDRIHRQFKYSLTGPYAVIPWVTFMCFHRQTFHRLSDARNYARCFPWPKTMNRILARLNATININSDRGRKKRAFVLLFFSRDCFESE